MRIQHHGNFIPCDINGKADSFTMQLLRAQAYIYTAYTHSSAFSSTYILPGESMYHLGNPYTLLYESNLDLLIAGLDMFFCIGIRLCRVLFLIQLILQALSLMT